MLMERMEGKAKQLCKSLEVARNSKAGRRAGRRRNPQQGPLITIPLKEKVHGSLGQRCWGTWGQGRWFMPQWVCGAGTRT